MIARDLKMSPVAHFERDVVYLRALSAGEVHRVVVRVAPQEDKEVLNRVGELELEYFTIEISRLCDILYIERDVTERAGPNAVRPALRYSLRGLVKDRDLCALGIPEEQTARDSRRRVGLTLGAHAIICELPRIRGQICTRWQVKAEFDTGGGAAALKHDRTVVERAGEIYAVGLAGHCPQAKNVRIIVFLPSRVWGLETGIANAADLIHPSAPLFKPPLVSAQVPGRKSLRNLS